MLIIAHARPYKNQERHLLFGEVRDPQSLESETVEVYRVLTCGVWLLAI